jgi:SulP family sulfate permease
LITETRGRGNKEAIAQGVANILSGVFWYGWLLCWDKALLMFLMVQEQDFQIVAAIALLLCHVWCWSNRVLPMAALTGLMIMVGTFRWASLKL